jgi:hypothetical protein
MPEITLNGDATYPGVTQVIDCQYTCGWSVSPGRVVLTILPQDVSEIQGTGDLFLSDGLNPPVRIADCTVTDLAAPDGDTGPLVLTLLDGRWRWNFGAVFGRYNLPFDRYLTIPPLEPPTNAAGNPLLPPEAAPPGEEVIRRRATAPELAKILLDMMQVKKYDLRWIDPEATPRIEWDATNPALALAQLASELGCVVAFNPSTLAVSLTPQGDGDGLPPGELQVAPQLSARPRPDLIRLYGARDRVQMRFPLMAVGIDFDGSYRPLWELSYRPADGDWTRVDPSSFGQVAPNDYLPGAYQRHDAIALAKATVYKCYAPMIFADPAADTSTVNQETANIHPNPVLTKLEKELFGKTHKPPRVYGVQYRPKKDEPPKPYFWDARVLPLKCEVTQDDTGRIAVVPAKVYGRHTPPPKAWIGGLQGSLYDDTNVNTEVQVPFTIQDIGNDNQLIVFSRQVYARHSEGKVYPPELVIECAVELATDDGQFYRTPWDLRLPNGPGRAQSATTRAGGYIIRLGNKPTRPAVIVRDDVRFQRIAKYGSVNDFQRFEDNESVIADRASYYLRGEAQRYELIASGDATYPGIQPMFPTGTWMQVTWGISPPVTRVSMNTEHALYLPSFRERRELELTNLELRRQEMRKSVTARVFANGAVL